MEIYLSTNELLKEGNTDVESVDENMPSSTPWKKNCSRFGYVCFCSFSLAKKDIMCCDTYTLATHDEICTNRSKQKTQLMDLLFDGCCKWNT